MNEAELAQNLPGGLQWLDFAVLGSGIMIFVVIAYLTGRKESDTKDFFLGRRRTPALIACLSFVATEISAVTIIGVPATGFAENWQYLQFFIGSAAARILIAFLFIPMFYKHDCTTIYEFLKHRFGSQTQYSGAVFFFITRLLASGVRLYAACLGVSVIMGWSLQTALILFTAASIAFIAFGGIKAVMWTGAYATLIFYLAGLAVAGYLISCIDGGLSGALQVGREAGKLSLFNLRLSVSDPTTLLGATMNAFFVGLVVFGTDQELVQRLLTVRTRKSSQRALISTIAVAFPLVCLYLAVGTLLFVFYRQQPQLALPEKTDAILSHFVVHSLPVGLKGLVLMAIVLASIDSPLSSLSSSFVTDIYRPLVGKLASERHCLWVSRGCVVGFGILLAGVAYLCTPLEGLLWFAFKIIGVTGGSTLGVFLLGLLTKRTAKRANVVAMTSSAVAMTVLLILSEKGVIALGWSWLIVIGTAFTFGCAYVLGPIMDGRCVEHDG